MDRKNLYFGRVFLAFIAVIITTWLVSCGFQHGELSLCYRLDQAPVKQATSSQQYIEIQDPDTIVVYSGSGCAESNKSGEEDIIKVEQSLDLPPYATNATVFLNGWHLQYLHSDHRVTGLTTLVRNIELNRRTLKWQAVGLISDLDFNEAYNWCYYYTVIAWNPSKINLTVDHDDGPCSGVPSETREANFFTAKNDGTTSALSSFPTFLQNLNFASTKTVAILPRGFEFQWSGGDDHHMLQMGYNLDHSKNFMEKGKKYYKGLGDTTRGLPSQVESVPPDPGYVSWETYGIFKDDDTRRDYTFGEIVSGLGGNDVGVIQPPFSILPKKGSGLLPEPCVGDAKNGEFVIENVPYEYAIPMLTGWDLNYPSCGDQHVAKVGVWIDEWNYEKIPGAPAGALRYKISSVLNDEDNTPYVFNHKVTVLGLKPVVPRGIPSQRSPDLVPFSLSGTDPTAFCRIEQRGELLRVTVKNQGEADADPSKTIVNFGNMSVELDTPSIPAGGSVDLLFDVPASCFSPDCSFKITVDSNNQVDELNNEGNNSVDGGCIG